ncbi:MAG: hypothetical protein ACJ8EY_11330 [Sphingomicrobium sp.]
MSRIRTLLLPIAVIASPGSAMPPPVPVAPLVLQVGKSADLETSVAELVEILGEKGFYALEASRPDRRSVAACLTEQEGMVECVAKALSSTVSSENAVVLIVYSEVKPDVVRMLCIGRDAKRASEKLLRLSDALREDAPNMMAERAELASCMIGALHAW